MHSMITPKKVLLQNVERKAPRLSFGKSSEKKLVMTLREESLSKTKHLLNKETLFKKKRKKLERIKG